MSLRLSSLLKRFCAEVCRSTLKPATSLSECGVRKFEKERATSVSLATGPRKRFVTVMSEAPPIVELVQVSGVAGSRVQTGGLVKKEMENWGKYVGVVKVRMAPAGMFAEDFSRSVRVVSVKTSVAAKAVDNEENGGAMKFGFICELLEPTTWSEPSLSSTL